MAMNLGVPLKLLQEFLNRKITVEASCGEVYKGVLVDAEENMSLSLKDVSATLIDGRAQEMKAIYIKGSRIRLINLPETANDSIPNLTRPSFQRGRGGFRGGRGGGGRGGGGRGGGFGKPRYDDRRRY